MDISNENQQIESFYTYRKVTKCLSDGISFLSNNLIEILRISSPVAVIQSLLLAGLIFMVSDSKFVLFAFSNSSVDNNTIFIDSIIILTLSALLFLTSSLFMGLVYRLIVIKSHNLPLKNLPFMQTYKISAKYGLKYLCYSVSLFVIGAVMGIILVSPMMIETQGEIFTFIKVAFVVLLMVTFVLLCLPLNISLPAIYLKKGKLISSFFYGYKKGLKIWNKVFSLSWLIGLLCFFVMIVLSLPCIIMINSYYSANLSILNGDAVTIPSGFSFWYYIVLFVTCYLFTFTLWIRSVSFAYLYASVKSDEKEEERNSYLKLTDK